MRSGKIGLLVVVLHFREEIDVSIPTQSLPPGILNAVEHVPDTVGHGTPVEPIIPGNPIFPTNPATPILGILFNTGSIDGGG